MHKQIYQQLKNFKTHIDDGIKLKDEHQSLCGFLSENQGHCLAKHLKDTINANKHEPHTLNDQVAKTIHDIQTLIYAYPVLSTQVAINIIEAEKTFDKEAKSSDSPTMDELAESFVSFLARNTNDYDLAWQRTFNFHQHLVANPNTRYKNSKIYTTVMESKIPEGLTAFGSENTIKDALRQLKKPTDNKNQTKGSESMLQKKSFFRVEHNADPTSIIPAFA